MTRSTAQQRRERRQAQNTLAEMGEDWLAIRESGAFLLQGFPTFEAYREQMIVRRSPTCMRTC